MLALAIAPGYAQNETLYAGVETGLYVSKNGGRSWRPTPFPEELAPVLSLAVARDAAQDGFLFAGTEAAGLWMSADRGQTWRRVGAEIFSESVNAILLARDFPAEPAILALATEGLFISHDCGATWRIHPTGLPAAAELTAVAAPAGLRSGAPLLVGTDKGTVLRLA